MESVDTNVILRLILNDIPEQRKKIINMLNKPDKLYVVSDLAITEVVYNLEKNLHRSREYIITNLKELLSNGSFSYNVIYFEQIFPMYLAHPKLSFNDCYLAIEAKEKNHTPLWTFDHKLALQSSSARQIP